MQNIKLSQKNISLDLQHIGYVNTIYAQQGDENARELTIYLFDDGKEYPIPKDATVSLCGTRADKTVVYRDVDSVEGNIVKIIFQNAELAAKGTAKYKIEIKTNLGEGETQLLTSTPFNIKVYENIYDEDGKLASPQYSDLQRELEKIREQEDNIEKEESKRVQAETIRESNESTRTNAESTRIENENIRVESEAQRSQAEANRIKQENQRNLAETARGEAEKIREANENTRKTNEQQRQSNEQQRQDNTSAAIKNAEAATKNANGAAADVQEKLKSLESQTYTHPDSGVTPGTYKSVTVDKQGHVTYGTNPTTLSDYGITDAANSSHTHSNATTSADGFMSKSDKSKLNGIAASSTTPMAPAPTASVGKENAYARGDHVHPAQTSVSGNAGTATKLATARYLKVNLKSTEKVTFDGSDNQENIPVTGILGAANGGTGQTSLYASIGALLHALNKEAFLNDGRTIPDDYRIPILTGTNWNTMNFSYVSKRFLKVEDSTVHVNIANNRGTYLTKNKCMFGFAIVYSSGCSALCGSASSVIYLEGGTSPAGYTLEANYGSSSLANKKFVKIIGFYY